MQQQNQAYTKTTLLQISDFGLAKLMPEGKETCVTARVLGTFGYFDPEYTSVKILTESLSLYKNS